MHSGMLQFSLTTSISVVVFEKVYDIAGLLYVVDMGDNLVAVFFVEFLDKVYGLVGVEVAHEFTGDVLGLHVGEELVAVVFVELHEHVGGLVASEELVEVFGLVEVEVVVELGDVGGVELVEEFARLGIVVFGDDSADVVEIFFVKLLHNGKAPLRGG